MTVNFETFAHVALSELGQKGKRNLKTVKLYKPKCFRNQPLPKIIDDWHDSQIP